MRTICIFIIIVSSVARTFAQSLPIDPALRTGKLDNGMTYYIRHNATTNNRADFYLACNVGAVLEEDHENGLAHFLEHMAFNGGRNFPGNSVIDYLAKNGVKFGENLNATTYADRTVYRIGDTPVANSALVDSCLLILHDWACGLTLDDKEIEQERGVIREEMRMVLNADRRLDQSLKQQIMPASPYAWRNVIGTEDIIMNFNPDILRGFYHKWYRPDLQAIIVVGDVDPVEMETKIRSLFSQIPAPTAPVERKYYSVEDNESALVAIATDSETSNPMIGIYYKYPTMLREEKGTMDGILQDYVNIASSFMAYNRLQQLLDQPEPPLVDGTIYHDQFMNTATCQAWQGIGIVRGNNYEQAVKTFAREMERIARYGFTAPELEQAKQSLLAVIENELKEQPNKFYAEEYVDHFLIGGYIPGKQTEYEILKQLSEQMPVEVINDYIAELMSNQNVVITLTAPEKQGAEVPTKEQLLAWFTHAKKEDLTAYEEAVSNQPLLSQLPKGGKIISEESDKRFSSTILTLSNGVKVVIKPTNLVTDEITMVATSPGGTSHFPETNPVNIALYNDLAHIGGLGEFSNRQLSTMLGGCNVSLTPVISTTTEGFTGSSSIRDFETMLQLIYLNFTAPRADEDAFRSFIARKKSELENTQNDISKNLTDALRKTAYINQARHHSLTATDLDQADYNTILQWRKDRYADAGDFTFVFAGSIDLSIARDLIAHYLGSLPATGRNEMHLDIIDGYHPGIITHTSNIQTADPQAIVVQVYSPTLDLSLPSFVKADMLAQIMNALLMAEIREKNSNVYSINANAHKQEYPAGLLQFQINYFSDPTRVDAINLAIEEQINKILAHGPSEDNMRKAKEFMLKSHQDRAQRNHYWAETIAGYYAEGYDSHTDYAGVLEEITADDVRQMAKMVFDSGKKIEVRVIGGE